MKFIKVKSQDAVSTIQDFLLNGKKGFAYCIHDEKSIFTVNAEDFNQQACNNLGYKVLYTGHTGGVVVVNPGDISIVHFGSIGNKTMHDFANRLVQEYQKRDLNAYFDGNDVLIDGYKISGLSATPYGNLQYSTIHIGINTNLEDIKAICTKPMIKIPKGLSEYNITAEEIEQMFLEFCNQI